MFFLHFVLPFYQVIIDHQQLLWSSRILYIQKQQLRTRVQLNLNNHFYNKKHITIAQHASKLQHTVQDTEADGAKTVVLICKVG